MENIILIDDNDSATYRSNIEGWVSRNGRFYGSNEHSARYDGCTHTKCTDCGAVVTKGRTRCESCFTKKSIERYRALERTEWDGITPVYSEAIDEFFFDGDSLAEYIEENDASDLRLVLCKEKNID